MAESAFKTKGGEETATLSKERTQEILQSFQQKYGITPQMLLTDVGKISEMQRKAATGTEFRQAVGAYFCNKIEQAENSGNKAFLDKLGDTNVQKIRAEFGLGKETTMEKDRALTALEGRIKSIEVTGPIGEASITRFEDAKRSLDGARDAIGELAGINLPPGQRAELTASQWKRLEGCRKQLNEKEEFYDDRLAAFRGRLSEQYSAMKTPELRKEMMSIQAQAAKDQTVLRNPKTGADAREEAMDRLAGAIESMHAIEDALSARKQEPGTAAMAQNAASIATTLEKSAETQRKKSGQGVA